MNPKSLLELANDLDDEDTWLSIPNIGQGLKNLERELRCPICCDFLRAPVTTPCLHSFCSECVRKTARQQLKTTERKAYCPTCKERLPDRNDFAESLFANASIEAMVDSFTGIRSCLKQALGLLQGKQPSNETHQDDTNHQQSTHRRSSRRTAAPHNPNTTTNNDNTITTRTKLGRPYLHGKKKSQLQALLRPYGLDTTGSEQDLGRRYTEFVELYNAECDSRHPREVPLLVQIIHQRERQRRSQVRETAHDRSALDRIKAQRKAQETQLSSGNAEFDRKLNAGFAQLIAQAKRRKQQKPPATPPTTASADESTPPNNNTAKLDYSNLPSSSQIDDDCDIPDSAPPSKRSPLGDERHGAPSLTPTLTSSSSSSESRLPIKPSPREESTASRSNSPFDSPAPTHYKRDPPVLLQQQPNTKRPRLSRVAKRTSFDGSSLVRPWKCPRCTFFNETNVTPMARCAICSHRRSDPVPSVDLTVEP